MVRSVLAAWPLFLFGVLEPLALTYAYFTAMADPHRFFVDQVPEVVAAHPQLSPQALAMTLQMGNVYLLLAALAVVCCWTTHTPVVRWYLISVALADLGHIYGTAKGMGSFFWDVSTWNDMVWGNVGASAFLHVNRWMTVLGLFGSLRGSRP